MKKVIVIGAKGQDGFYLSELLERNGSEVIRIDQDTIEPAAGGGSTFDICDPFQVETLVKKAAPDEIYHLAAFHHSAEDQYAETLNIFEKSTAVHEYSLFNFLSAIVKHSPATRLFYAASSLIFGDPPSEIQNESTPINPVNLYGITKAAGLFLCRKFRKDHGIFASCGILYNHESPRRSPNFLSRKITNGVIAAKKDESARLELGNLESVADWGYAPDYAAAMVKILSADAPDDFIVATGVKHTVRDFAAIAYASAGLSWQDHVAQKPGILNRVTKPLIGDATKLRRLTGWAPSITFEDMVKYFVQEGILDDQKR